MAFTWGYTKDTGPEKWAQHYAAAKGNRQTPIDILPSQAQFDADLKAKPLKIEYNPKNCETILNNGRSFQVPVDGKGSTLEGGPLSHHYEIAQFHMHWGKTSNSGSEHRIDGKMYAAELHIVHWNTELFKSVTEAISQDNGLCVLGMFVKPGREHAGVKRLTDLLPKIKYAGDKVDIPGGFNPACLLPNDTTKYWTYLGSLTTPPCWESVTWVVFKEPIEMSEEQLDAFRSLCSYQRTDKQNACSDEFHGHIVENYRPPLALNDRKVRATFRKFFV